MSDKVTSIDNDRATSLKDLKRPGMGLQGWWSNERTRSQARYGWLAAGWRVTSVNMKGLSVTFESGPV